MNKMCIEWAVIAVFGAIDFIMDAWMFESFVQLYAVKRKGSYLLLLRKPNLTNFLNRQDFSYNEYIFLYRLVDLLKYVCKYNH